MNLNDIIEEGTYSTSYIENSPKPDTTIRIRRQWREIGETDWQDCDVKWFNYCESQPEYDTCIIRG